ncbi:SMI1/KNR4 family protein [Lentzea sp. JNUCC 0626]|uniref:SMI1/KNR4 family protein n=1 Tax=Lentzea sp. JNUCC 0626 TaxID=3367513 RepID=UPI003748B5B1
MQNDLKALWRLVAPPARPVAGNRSWDWLFAELGTALPADYVALMKVYGGGTFGRGLFLWTPLDERGLPLLAPEAIEDARSISDEQPLPMWPEPGGFLPFGENIEGDKFGWLTSGDPDSWPLIFLERHGDPDEQEPPLPLSLAALIVEWLSGRSVQTINLPVFGPEDNLRDRTLFEPLT